MARLSLALAVVLAFLFAALPARAEPARVLFIGNELIDRTDIPGRLAKLAKAMGRDAQVESLAFDGFSLADHWRDPRTQDALKKKWDYVVLQQGPSGLPLERQELLDYTKKFAGPIREAGAKPALLMTWPSSDRQREFPLTLASYRAAAQAVDALLIPAGEAWLRILSKDRRAPLYSGRDNASSLGGDLTVLCSWFALFPAGPREFTDDYVAKVARALDIDESRKETWVDAATRSIDEPLPLR
jgi:hypothetical protein